MLTYKQESEKRSVNEERRVKPCDQICDVHKCWCIDESAM